MIPNRPRNALQVRNHSIQFSCFVHTDLHLVLRFWNQVLTCASVILRLFARAARSALARYFCRWNLFSSSQIWTLEKDVRGFFRLGGVRFWYGCPIRLVTANGTRAAAGEKKGKWGEHRWGEDEISSSSKRINSLPTLYGNLRPYITDIRPVWQQFPV